MKYTNDARERLITEYQSCGQIRLAADRAGVNERTAANWLIDAGLHTRQKRKSYRIYTTGDRQRLIDEFQSCGQIRLAARRAGVNECTASNWLVDAGLHTRKPKRSPDPEVIAEMRRLRHQEKSTIRSIAHATGWSAWAVSKYTRQPNTRQPNRPPNPAEIAEMRWLRRQADSTAKTIARKTGWSAWTVYKYTREPRREQQPETERFTHR